MHCGFWYKNTKNIRESVINENQFVIDKGKIKTGNKVLDAGCGVGGTAIYIAKKTGAKVFGVSISKKQISLARYYAKKASISRLTDFRVCDYSKTKFPDNYFDVVYGVESICYVYPKKLFLKEAFRILKPGGKLIILDGYMGETVGKEESRVISDFEESFSVKKMISYREMTDELKRWGFSNIQSEDLTDLVKPSVRYYNKIAIIVWPFLKFLSLFSFGKAVYKNALALISMSKGVEGGFGKYFFHYAQKPRIGQ